MPGEPQLQIHFRIRSCELRERLDAYCVNRRWSLTTALNFLIEQGLETGEANTSGGEVRVTPPA
ncbi:MAG: hypothetical protein ACRDRO_21590 [Pseudonocardiaceae bacterium]